MANWYESDPQQAQAILQQIEGSIGRSLTPDEIAQTKTALAGDTLDKSKLTGVIQSLPRGLSGVGGSNTQSFTQPGIGAGGTMTGPTANPPPQLQQQFMPPGIGPNGTMTGPTATAGASSGGGGSTGPDSSPLFPNFQIPTYHAPNFRQAPAFQLPTLEEAQNAPGYQFGVQQGEQALQQSRAAQGLLRTGGTLKDILDYGRQAATQNYGNVAAQKLAEYNTNYQTQYQDPNAFAFQSANADFYNPLAGNTQALNVGDTAFRDELAGANSAATNQIGLANARLAPQVLQYQTNASNAQRQNELQYNSDWQNFLNQQQTFYTNQSSPFAKYLALAQLGSGVA
jgi:hypothetical protein